MLGGPQCGALGGVTRRVARWCSLGWSAGLFPHVSRFLDLFGTPHDRHPSTVQSVEWSDRRATFTTGIRGFQGSVVSVPQEFPCDISRGVP